ncbi:hypothetical protein H0H81_003167 [Sphagnurus paluster]|uniref:Uncharacterized protein n=1 Tax=Sphagnurus paluster TaxID=117069 RepID=A0A9P7KMT6_9AGAR|nr:hypothetical protein H0H81_003167 [Sphagnurus paluster]
MSLKWDNYLATYSASLPNDASRAGNFKPLPRHSLWGRLFGFPAHTGKDDILCPLSPPPAKHTRSSMAKDPVAFMSDDEHIAQQPLSKYDDLPPSPTFLKKARSQNTKFRPMKKPKNFQSITSGRKQPIKFGENLSSDSSDSESDPNRGNARPWLKSKVSLGSSSPTLVDEPTRHPEDVLDIELGKLKKARQKAGDGVGGMPEYSDYEEDLGSPRTEVGTQEGQVGWSPGFMKQSSSIAARGNSRSVDAILSTGGPHGVLPLPMGAVPATPSLIKALDRISAAQRDAFSAEVVVSTPTSSNDPSSNHPSSYSRNQKGSTHVEGLPKLQDHQTDGLHEVENTHNRAPMWEQFWREVRHKAQS